MIEQHCKHVNSCCKIMFCPLVVAFGRTIHTFQGQEEGPGKPIERIVVDPGPKQFESINPGTLNCCITRAKTIGNQNERNSAIYFTGHNITHERSGNLIHCKSGKLCQHVYLRKCWVQFLQKKKRFDSIIEYHSRMMNVHT